MKRFSLLLVLVLISGMFRAQPFKAVTDAPTLTWFGLDFSKAKMVGSFSGPLVVTFGYQVTTLDGTGNTALTLRDNFYVSINELILNEPKRYDLKKFMANKEFEHNIEPVTKINAQINLDSIKIIGTYKSTPFSKEKIQAVVSAYKSYMPEGATGIGVCMVVEKFDNINKNAVVNIVFFDIKPAISF